MNNRIKRSNDELKADRPTLDELEFIPKNPIYFMLENIRSVHNVGSIFRTADGFGASQLYLTGYTAHPPRNDLTKTALGSEQVVPWVQYDCSLKALENIISRGITPIVIEQTFMSKSIYDLDYKFPVCIILGNEVEGVTEQVVSKVNLHAEIPMKGVKQSLNVSVAAGIAGFEILRQYLVK